MGLFHVKQCLQVVKQVGAEARRCPQMTRTLANILNQHVPRPVRTFQSDRKIQAGVGCSGRLMDLEGPGHDKPLQDLFTTFVLLRSSKHSLNIKSCRFLQ